MTESQQGLNYLQNEAHRFEFLQLVRLLERARPETRPVGEGVEPDKETMRFRSRVGLDFPGTDVARLVPGSDAERKPPELWVNFMGLAGQFGPLPQVFTELIQERAMSKDTSARDFLDIFNHRLLSLLVRIHKKNIPGFQVKPPGEADFSKYLFSLLGMGTRGLRNRQHMSDRALISMAGLMLRTTRTVSGLKAMLKEYFNLPVEANQFKGKWRDLESDQLSRISSRGGGAPLNGQAALGKRGWDQQGAFELVLGPLDRKQFQDFLPTGEAYPMLTELIRYYAGPTLDLDLILVLKAEPLNGVLLSTGENADRLGWTSWLSGDDNGENLEVKIDPETQTVRKKNP